MKILISILLLLCSISLAGQNVYLDEYKASVVDSLQAKYYEIIDYDTDSKTFKKRTYAITGEKQSEFDFVVSPNSEGNSILWYLGIPDKKFIQNGVSLSWYKNGQLASQSNFVNGKKEGKDLTWYENGKLKSDWSLVHGKGEGECISWFDNGQLQCRETYANGKREGKSVTWYEKGQLRSDFNYSKGLYNGDIIIYWSNGQIKRKDQYVDNKFLKGACYDSLGNEVKHTDLESMPIYKGGDIQLLKDIWKRTQYPPNSRAAGIQGKVVVEFAVDKNGEITEREILEGVNNELNSEAIRVIGTLKFKPGMLDGEALKVYYQIPIVFKISR